MKMHDWEDAFSETLRRVAGAELVVTDRLHGMLFAAITGTPCVAFDNKTGKVHSVYEWIAGCEYVQVCRGLDEFDAAMHKALNSPRKWDNSGLLPYFSKITSLITERV
ncbi:MAG: polysaccharide pyruvyl transferase family protein [Synergistaceae bacterium]|nr:polysaccharide pyruvyl transferase family protein [Synergistaceae bacterium]